MWENIIIVELAAFLLEVMIAAFKFIIDPIRQILKKSPLQLVVPPTNIPVAALERLDEVGDF